MICEKAESKSNKQQGFDYAFNYFKHQAKYFLSFYLFFEGFKKSDQDFYSRFFKFTTFAWVFLLSP